MADEQIPTVETEQIEVDGKLATVSLSADDQITITRPEGLSDDDFAAWKQQVETGSRLVGTWNKKNFEANQRIKSLDQREAELAEREARLGKHKETPEPDDGIAPIWKRLGLESEDDLADYMADNPVKYHKEMTALIREETAAEMKRQLGTVEQQTKLAAQEQILSDRIRAAGVDPRDVQNFARHYNMPYGQGAFELYASQNQIKTDPILNAQLEAQKRQIKYVEQGERTFTLGTRNYEDLTDEELKIAAKQYKEKVRNEQA